MGFGLIKQKYALCSLFVVLLIFLSGCDPYAEKYPFLEESMWVSNDPHIEITYTKDLNGITSANEFLEWNGELIEINLHFQASSYGVFPANVNAYEKRLFTGTWKYQRDNLVLIIEEDFIFDNKYSEIVFEKK